MSTTTGPSSAALVLGGAALGVSVHIAWLRHWGLEREAEVPVSPPSTTTLADAKELKDELESREGELTGKDCRIKVLEEELTGKDCRIKVLQEDLALLQARLASAASAATTSVNGRKLKPGETSAVDAAISASLQVKWPFQGCACIMAATCGRRAGRAGAAETAQPCGTDLSLHVLLLCIHVRFLCVHPWGDSSGGINKSRRSRSARNTRRTEGNCNCNRLSTVTPVLQLPFHVTLVPPPINCQRRSSSPAFLNPHFCSYSTRTTPCWAIFSDSKQCQHGQYCAQY